MGSNINISKYLKWINEVIRNNNRKNLRYEIKQSKINEKRIKNKNNIDNTVGDDK